MESHEMLSRLAAISPLRERITPSSIAKVSGLSVSCISRIVRGERFPRRKTICAIADTLEVSIPIVTMILCAEVTGDSIGGIEQTLQVSSG